MGFLFIKNRRKMESKNYLKKAYVGIRFGGEKLTDVELLPSNGISERIFSNRLIDRAYTWMGNVLSAGIKRVGNISVGEKVRDEYLRTRGISIPAVILATPLADVNTLLVEIHRTLWLNIIRNQEAICKYCGEPMRVDIDLDRIVFEEEDLSKLDKDWEYQIADLKSPYKFSALGKKDDKLYAEFDGLSYNRLVFRIPVLADAIKHEKISSDSVMFWRNIALDCLVAVQDVQNNIVVGELPIEAIRAMGIRLFDLHLSSTDLINIRTILREELPALPFYYEEECANAHCRRMTPVTMEASSFFSS